MPKRAALRLLLLHGAGETCLPLDNGLNITQDSLCREALHDPIAFWKKQTTSVHWFSRYKSVFDETRAPFYRWFPGGLLNACYEAVDTHVLTGKGGKCAIIYDSPVTGVKQKISYEELLERVRSFAAALLRRGVEKGDRVLIYMPLVPEAAVAMLACARIGAMHVVTFGGFGRGELALRIDHAKPKVIVAASCGVEPRRVVPYKAGLDQALQLAQHKPEFKVVLQRRQHIWDNLTPEEVDWNTFLQEGTSDGRCEVEGAKSSEAAKSAEQVTAGAAAAAAARAAAAAASEREATPVESNHPLYILYTSGTTGSAKGVVRDHVGQCVSSFYAGSAIYDINPGDTIFCASDLGWVLGHSIMLYGSLINGATTLFYEGKPTMTPDAGAFWRLIAEYGVSKLFTAPSAFRAIRAEDPAGRFIMDRNLETLKVIYLVGERTDRATMRWLSGVLRKTEKIAKSPHVKYPLLVDHWWQTETGWPVTCIMTGFPLKPKNFIYRREGSCGKPCPGWNVRILDDAGEEVEGNVSGHIALKLPLPPGALTTLYNDNERYVKTYLSRFPGYYDTGDTGFFDEDGYLYIEGRTDDVLNVAAHRLSALAIEEVLTRHPGVAAAAVVAVADCIKGQVPVGVVVPQKTAATKGSNRTALNKGTTEVEGQSAVESDITKQKIDATHSSGGRDVTRIAQEQQPASTEATIMRQSTLSMADQDLVTELVQEVRENIGPFACFKSCVIVNTLPRTRSGKVLRKTVGLILEGREYVVPAAIEDATALKELEIAVKKQLGITGDDGKQAAWANGLPNL